MGGKKSVETEKATGLASAVVRQLIEVASPVFRSVAETKVHEDFDGRWARFFSPCRTLGQLLALPQAACRRY